METLASGRRSARRARWRAFRRASRNVRCRAYLLAFCVATYVAIGLTAHATLATVKSASSDGETTVYLKGKFSSDFDVAYRATLRPAAHNKSWSTLSILLVGSQIPGPGASVGVASDPTRHGSVRAFTYVVYPSLKDSYESHSTNCAEGCLIELRGDTRNIYAYVNGNMLASWSRSDLYLRQPRIQLNAEVHRQGDSIFASLTPFRNILAGHILPRPSCAFTTRGIEPVGLATLTFHGKTSDAGGAFINLITGVHGDHC